MANFSREQLEAEAGTLGVEYDSDTKFDTLKERVMAARGAKAKSEREADPADPALDDSGDDGKKVPTSSHPKGTKFFSTRIHGLQVVVGDRNPSDPTLQKFVRFQPFMRRWEGESVRVGYLATDSAEAIKALENDGNVFAMSQSEYDSALKRGTPIAY